MKQWNFKAIGIGCGGVFALTVARLGVSLGRLLYTLRSGSNAVGMEELPTWQQLVFGDGFFYIGILALVGCIGCMILDRKKK